MTNEQYLTHWQEWFEHNLGRAGTSVEKYLVTLRRLAKYLKTNKMSLIDADRAALDAFCGPVAHASGLAPRSRRPLVAAVRSFYGWLESTEHIDSSPAKLLEYPKSGKPLPVMMTAPHAEKLLMSCKDLSDFVTARDAAIIALLLATGLRVSGASNMNVEQLFTGQDNAGKPLQLMRVVEKGGKERIVPISTTAKLYLELYIKHPDFIATKNERLLEDGKHVMFIQTNRGSCELHNWHGERRRLSTKGIERILVRRGERLGIPRSELHPHAIRHLFGTTLIENNVDLHRAKMMMGHSNIDTTSIYVHLAVEKLAQMAEHFSPLSGMNGPVNQLAGELRKLKG